MKVTKSFIKVEGVRVFFATIPLEIPGMFFKVTKTFIKDELVRVFCATVLFEILVFEL